MALSPAVRDGSQLKRVSETQIPYRGRHALKCMVSGCPEQRGIIISLSASRIRRDVGACFVLWAPECTVSNISAEHREPASDVTEEDGTPVLVFGENENRGSNATRGTNPICDGMND